jgi:hypothetical protein
MGGRRPGGRSMNRQPWAVLAVLWPRRRTGIDTVYVIVIPAPQTKESGRSEKAEPSRIHPVIFILRQCNLAAALPQRLPRIPRGLCALFAVQRRGPTEPRAQFPRRRDEPQCTSWYHPPSERSLIEPLTVTVPVPSLRYRALDCAVRYAEAPVTAAAPSLLWNRRRNLRSTTS